MDAKISTLYNPSSIKFNAGSSKITDLINGTKAGFDVVNLVFIVVGLLFFANLVAGGWNYMLSSGDPKKASVASARITNGLTGLIMAFTAFLIVRLISLLLGLNGPNSHII
jgi:hypothetical protein